VFSQSLGARTVIQMETTTYQHELQNGSHQCRGEATLQEIRNACKLGWKITTRPQPHAPGDVSEHPSDNNRVLELAGLKAPHHELIPDWVARRVEAELEFAAAPWRRYPKRGVSAYKRCHSQSNNFGGVCDSRHRFPAHHGNGQLYRERK
jgi:thymidylate synthase ThyX